MGLLDIEDVDDARMGDCFEAGNEPSMVVRICGFGKWELPVDLVLERNVVYVPYRLFHKMEWFNVCFISTMLRHNTNLYVYASSVSFCEACQRLIEAASHLGSIYYPQLLSISLISLQSSKRCKCTGSCGYHREREAT